MPTGTPPASASPPNEDRLKLSLQKLCAEKGWQGVCNFKSTQAKLCPLPPLSCCQFLRVAYECNSWPGEHLLPWWSSQVSICVAFWFWPTSVNHKLSLNLSLSLHMTAPVGCGKSNQEKEAMLCRIPIDFFFPGMSAEWITAQWKLAAQFSFVVNKA